MFLSFIVVIMFTVFKLPSKPVWLARDWANVIRLYNNYYAFMITLCTMFDSVQEPLSLLLVHAHVATAYARPTFVAVQVSLL